MTSSAWTITLDKDSSDSLRRISLGKRSGYVACLLREQERRVRAALDLLQQHAIHPGATIDHDLEPPEVLAAIALLQREADRGNLFVRKRGWG